MKVGSLFSGIGGLDLGLERAGMQIVWQVEIDEFCRQVLDKHWPRVPKYRDVRELSGSTLEAVDIICGGFPCQPVSLAGRRQAQGDPRWLWPEFARLVDELRPRYVLVENVPGLLSAGGAEVVADLASLGYDCRWDRLFAASVGAPHLRERIFLVAHSGSERRQQESSGSPSHEGTDGGRSKEDHQPSGDGEGCGSGTMAYASGTGLAGLGTECGLREGSGPFQTAGSDWWKLEPDVGRVAHGVPHRVDRLKGLGNAVVPQCAELVGRWIMELEAAG